MNADAILRVTVALRERLKAALTRSQVPGTVFVGPLDDPDAGGAALVLFLYRIAPAANLRNQEHRVPSGKPQPSVFVYQNSFPLDLFFLLTVGTTPGSSEETLLKALGYAIQEIQNSPDLVGSDVGHETVHVTFEPLSTEDASRIWALFPTANYRTSIAYLATPVWIDPPAEADLPPRVGHHELSAGVSA